MKCICREFFLFKSSLNLKFFIYHTRGTYVYIVIKVIFFLNSNLMESNDFIEFILQNIYTIYNIVKEEADRYKNVAKMNYIYLKLRLNDICKRRNLNSI